MKILVEKAKRRLTLQENGQTIFSCQITLGTTPLGAKTCAGDGKTPEGLYFVCMKKIGKFGQCLGVSYPGLSDAKKGLENGLIDEAQLALFERAEREKIRPPWGTRLGGEICIHAGSLGYDSSAGCMMLTDPDMAQVYPLCDIGDEIEILP